MVRTAKKSLLPPDRLRFSTAVVNPMPGKIVSFLE